ncbi:MAG: DUF805 domain-containing protein [Rhodothermales bacterium]
MQPEEYTTDEGYLTPAPETYKDILFSFEGRINRAKYWGYALVMMLAMVVVGLVGTALAGQAGFWVAYVLAMLVIIWPALALGVKRCHDRNRTGWFMLMSLVPIGNIWYMIEIGFLRGTDGPNDYGEDPLG